MLKTALMTSGATILALSLGSSAAFAQTGGTLEDVVVTAQRVEQTLQNAPVPVEAYDQEELARSGMESAMDLGALSPALGISAGGGPLTGIFVRGVGALAVNPLTDAAVAQNVDGVYLGRSSGAAGQALFDLERVELLKGPQGTLYGRNATGGVLNYLPKKPVLGETGAYIQAEVGNYNKIGLQSAVNLSLSDHTAIRISANKLDRDGYNDDGTADQDSFALRGQLLMEPNDNLSVRLAADYSEIGGKGPGGDLIGTYANRGDRSVFTPSGISIGSGPTADAANVIRTTVSHTPSFAPFQPIDGDDLFQDLSFTGVMAEVNYQFDTGTLTVIPAYRESEMDYAFAGPGFAPAKTKEDNSQVSLEARYATDFEGAFNGIIGAFYFDEEITTSTVFHQNYVAPIQNYENGGDSWAIFGQGTYDVTDTFRLNAGIRYTEDSKFVDGVSDTFVTFCGGAPFPPPLPNNLNPGGNPAVGDPDHDGNFPVGYSSIDNGCHTPGNIPALLITSDPDALIADLVARGRISPLQSDSPGPGWVISRLDGDTNSNRLATLTNLGDGELKNDLSYSETTYRIGAEWDWGPSNLLYAGFETGYRAGGVDLAVSEDVGALFINDTYDPEYIDAFTIGSKNRFFDNTLQVNAEAFFWEYEGQQVNYFTTLNSQSKFPIANADATIKGLDVDVIWAASDATTVSGNFQVLDSVYDSLELFSDANDGRFGCEANTPVGAYQSFDCSGQRMLYSPEFGGGLSVTHVLDMNDYDLALTVDANYRGEQQTNFLLLEDTASDAYTKFDIDATLSPKDANWSLTAFVRNATDEQIVTNSNVSNRGLTYATFTPPQTYGVRVRANFE